MFGGFWIATAFRHDQGAVEEIRKMDVAGLPLSEVLNQLGDKPLVHAIEQLDPAKAKMGEELIFLGQTMYNGKKSKLISSYFVCTDCHTTKRESADISKDNPAERLKFAEANGMPFLPGSTLWGIYNRTSFYNKDYEKKYGDLVVDARDTLQNAVQLCAKYCSAGRNLEPWEEEAIMHYFKREELKLSDLNLPEAVLKEIRSLGKLSPDEKAALIKKIKTYYSQKYDATFLETMATDKRKYGEGGNSANGELIYEKACMFCHENKRVTYLHLDKGKLSGKMFWKNRKNYSDLSLYQIVRHGTYSKTGRQQYMPLFTKEKMSDEQLNDLVAYIKKLARK